MLLRKIVAKAPYLRTLDGDTKICSQRIFIGHLATLALGLFVRLEKAWVSTVRHGEAL